MWSQVGLRKHHYEQSKLRWQNSTWATSSPKSWCCKSAPLNMPANLKNSAVAKSLEKVRKAMPKNVQTITQLHSSQLWTSRCSSWILKRQRNERSNSQHLLHHRRSRRIPKKHLFLLYDYGNHLIVWITTNCGKFWKRWEYQTTRPACCKMCMQVRKHQLKLDMEQLVPNRERSMSRLYIVTLLI